MAVTIYEDTDAGAIFVVLSVIGTWPYNSLQAVGDGAGNVSIRNKSKIYADGTDFYEITSTPYGDYVNDNGTAWGSSEAETVDALNAVFGHTGGAGGVAPVITSATTVNITEGDTLNYELTATGGVGYEWDSLPSGVATVDGNIRKLIGGSGLSVGTYPITATAINYFGTDTASIDLVVSAPPYSNTKSVRFNNQDWAGANAALLDAAMGRAGNGSGAGDAWSLGMWIKAGTSNNNNQTLFYYGGDGSSGGVVRLAYQGNSTSRRLQLLYGTSFNSLRLQPPASSITPGTWQHVLVTYDGGTTGAASGSLSDYFSRFSIYLDGVLQTTTNGHTNYGYTGAVSGFNLRLARYVSGNYSRGNLIDEVAVWGSDQSGNVADIYNSGNTHDLSALGTAPDHWWRMGDGDTFPTIQDNVGNAHFVLYNMTAADIVTDAP